MGLGKKSGKSFDVRLSAFGVMALAGCLVTLLAFIYAKGFYPVTEFSGYAGSSMSSSCS